MKSLAIMQPYFFPYIGYWQLIHSVDRFVIFDDVSYISRGWINRNRLLINGEARYMTVPLQQASQNKRICDISLQPASAWRDKLVRMVEITYRNTFCFDEVFPIIESLIRHEADNLSDYLAYQLKALASFLDIHAEFVLTSRCYGNNDLRGKDRIIDICKREGATTYINPQGGEGLYDRTDFRQCGLELQFLIPNLIEYKQSGALFVPWLSIIDVMMFNGITGTKGFLGKYYFK